MNIFEVIKSAIQPKPRHIYLAWIYESHGWVSFEVEAETFDEAWRKAHARFVGTEAFWTVEMDKEPVFP